MTLEGWATTGWKQVFFYDPDGNVVKVHQAPKDAPQVFSFRTFSALILRSPPKRKRGGRLEGWAATCFETRRFATLLSMRPIEAGDY